MIGTEGTGAFGADCDNADVFHGWGFQELAIKSDPGRSSVRSQDSGFTPQLRRSTRRIMTQHQPEMARLPKQGGGGGLVSYRSRFRSRMT
jgi:hypothetical protein